MGKLLLFAFFSSVSAMGFADGNCWGEAGARYKVDPWLLYAIASHESHFDATAVHVNSDGSEDLGIMQINSKWLPKLAALGIDRERLLKEVCTNINVGAWIISNNFYKYGANWNSVGAYNAGVANSPKQQRRRDNYASVIETIYRDYLHQLPR